MDINELIEEWNKDSKIDITELDHESIKIAKLHNKYYQIFAKERLINRRYEAELKRLKLDKYEFYTQGPSEETVSKGWKMPSKGMILKQEVNTYLEGDEDIINMSLKIGYQQEKIDFLESIIKSLQTRGYNIKSAIDFLRFKNGA